MAAAAAAAEAVEEFVTEVTDDDLSPTKTTFEAVVGVVVVELGIGAAGDLMTTVLAGATDDDPEDVVVVVVGDVAFTGDTRTRRTLPSAETLTNFTGTILAPGGTMWAGRRPLTIKLCSLLALLLLLLSDPFCSTT